MRKAYCAVAALLLALNMLSCEAPVFVEEEDVRYDPGGRRLVKVAVDTGGSNVQGERGLTQLVAQAVINYYEVVIYDGTNYRRAAGRDKILYVWLPEGMDFSEGATTEGVPNAIVFAGYHRIINTTTYYADSKRLAGVDLTLLAIGTCMEIDGQSVASNPVISSNTRSIKFGLVALRTEVTNNSTINNPLNDPTSRPSSFKITAPNGYRTVEDNNYHLTELTDNAAPGWDDPTTLYANRSYAPYFRVPINNDGTNNGTTIQARLKIIGLDGTLAATFGAAGDPARGIYVMPVTPPVVRHPLNTVKFVWGGDPIRTTASVDIAEGQLSTDTINNGFLIYIDTGKSTDSMYNERWLHGWAVIALKLPVIMYDTNAHTNNLTQNTRHEWYIRTGMYSEQPDQGYVLSGYTGTAHPPATGASYHTHSLGGGILLKVGNPPIPPLF